MVRTQRPPAAAWNAKLAAVKRLLRDQPEMVGDSSETVLDKLGAVHSAAEGARSADIMNDFADRFRELGPPRRSRGRGRGESPGRAEGDPDSSTLIKIQKKEKLAARPESEDDYDQLYTSGEIQELFDNVVSYWVDPEKCQAYMI